VKFEYLKPKTAACESLVKTLHLTLMQTEKSFELYQTATSLQNELNQQQYTNIVKTATHQAQKKGQKQGLTLGAVILLVFSLITL
jgi:hypothetical protein